jgi:hypothetical protein
MKTVMNLMRTIAEALLVLPLLPVIGCMWLAAAITDQPPGEEPQPSRLPPPAPLPLPERKPAPTPPQPLPRYIKREWRRRRHRLLSRILGEGDFVTEWQLR